MKAWPTVRPSASRAPDKWNNQWVQPTPRLEISACGLTSRELLYHLPC